MPKTDERVQALMMLEVMSRWLAKKAVKQKWKSEGRRPLEFDPVELAKATNQYLADNRMRLREEARTLLINQP